MDRRQLFDGQLDGLARTSVPQDWLTGLAGLSREAPLVGFSDVKWRLMLDDGLAFLGSQWAARAAELGWEEDDVFGVHPTAPAARFDCMGLVPILAGREVINLEQDGATIRSPRGSTLTYRRTPAGVGGVPVWACVHREPCLPENIFRHDQVRADGAGFLDSNR